MAIDLSSLASAHTFAVAFRERFSKLDVLVNNAAASSPALEITPEGFERDWATNVLGPYLLTTLLVPALRLGGRGRIVSVSTRAAGGLDLSDTQAARNLVQLPRPGGDTEAARPRRNIFRPRTATDVLLRQLRVSNRGHATGNASALACRPRRKAQSREVALSA